MDNVTTLQLWRWLPGIVDTLGPGRRVVVWMQGCARACPGCMVPETWPKNDGRRVKVDELVSQILAEPEHEGLTVSGGEPFEQPLGLAALLGGVKSSGWTTWVYTGYRIEELLALGDPAVDLALTRTDVLVDGAYERTLGRKLAFRGSSNQRILRLTDAIDADRIRRARGARVQMILNDDAEMVIVGIPPPGFMNSLRGLLRSKGIGFSTSTRQRQAKS